MQLSLESTGLEYHISYDVKMADGSDLPQGIDNNSIFGKIQTVVNEAGSYSFDVLIPYGYTARVFRYDDDNPIPIDLTGDRLDIPDPDIRKLYVVNDGFPLGTEPVYTGLGVVDTNAGPAKMKIEATFLGYEVNGDRYVVVELSKRTEPVYFDAHWGINFIGMNGRGSTGSSLNHLGGNLWPNIVTEDNWGWNSAESCLSVAPNTLTGAKLDKYKKHWYLDEETDTYSLQWIFQTNTGNFLLNVLAINGVNLSIPYIPEEVWNGNTKVKGDGEGSAGTYTETYVDDAWVKIRYVRAFNNETQRVYEVTITGAQCNMTITSANLTMYQTGAPELLLSKLYGISADGVTDHTVLIIGPEGDWMIGSQGDNLVNQTGLIVRNDPNQYGANVKFKILPGYRNPVFSYLALLSSEMINTNQNSEGYYEESYMIPWDKVNENLVNDMLKENYIYGPDEEGYYYIRLGVTPTAGSLHFLELYIVAANTRYVIRYMTGNVKDEYTNIPGTYKNDIFIPAKIINMPAFDPKRSAWDNTRDKTVYVDDNEIEHYDDNNGKLYDVINYYNVTIGDTIPIDSTNSKEFSGWVIVDRDEEPYLIDGNIIEYQQNTAIRLDELEDYADILDELFGGNELNVNVLRLKAKWDDV